MFGDVHFVRSSRVGNDSFDLIFERSLVGRSEIALCWRARLNASR